ncbi:MAG TPA: DNA primase [Micromonosporaceae bacterium]|nr:DNA primase [Micromonosporaceae bacterium]
MAGGGRIRDEDIALVRERSSIVDVASEQVTLKSAGGGNLKGLCPFHDEKTPSFTVAQARNVYFCHGCGEGGDVINFVQKIDHLTFIEAVERLAERAGIALRRIEGGSAPTKPTGQRQRLVDAHKAAAAFYSELLLSPAARPAREFLAQRGFDREAAQRYGCGFAPVEWDLLVKHLRQLGFTSTEMETAGLARQSRSGSLIDRFRRRLLWPIRDVSGDVIGFGARKIFDDDDGPKYLNTPESPLYKKSHVLYGVDMAKREIAKQGRAVIVEGYTDVMACHLAGVTTAVATCGTAFGNDHISVLRRLLLDTDTYGGEIIFTFDGDAAGQKAALRAFADDQRFVGQTFIAVSPDNMDPCELRLSKGDLAVRDLVASREPLIAFALRSTMARYDLDTVEGRVSALRATAPMVAKIKDRSLLGGYSQRLAGDLGLDVEEVRRAVQQAGGSAPAPQQRSQPVAANPRLLVEREALKLAVQSPVLAGPVFDTVDHSFYSDPLHQAIRLAIVEVGGASAGVSGPGWINTVRDACPDLATQMLVMELAVEPVRYDGEPDSVYLNVVLARLQLAHLKQRIDEVKSKLQRINPVTEKEEYHRRFSELLALEQHARALKEQAAGGL